ncbi:uncharacterized protein METZ01_LOCUS408837, partial [marine metagenome]
VKLFFVGILFSIVFFWFSIKGVEFGEIIIRLKDFNYVYLIPVVILSLLGAYLKSLRWGFILNPLKKIGQRELFPISCVGSMAIILFPMRIGELIKPYLISRESKIPLSAAISTVFVERVLDVLALLCIFFLVILNDPFIGIKANWGYSYLSGIIILIIFMFFIYYKKSSSLKFLRIVFKKIPVTLWKKIENIFHNIINGFEIIVSSKKLFYVVILTAFNW